MTEQTINTQPPERRGLHGALVWTDERVCELRRLWVDERKSAGICAAELGVTRSTLLGKVRRLGLQRKGEQSTVVLTRVYVRKERRAAEDASPAPATQSKAPCIKAVEVPPASGLRLVELTNCSCRWPRGEPHLDSFRFCGREEADMAARRPYCDEHAAVARGSRGEHS